VKIPKWDMSADMADDGSQHTLIPGVGSTMDTFFKLGKFVIFFVTTVSTYDQIRCLLFLFEIFIPFRDDGKAWTRLVVQDKTE
jgi:hypothetical protein